MMILPVTAHEHRYTHNLAALYKRAIVQRHADDRDGSNDLMAAYRQLKDAGERQFKERFAGLLEYVHVMVNEDPPSERLAAFMAAQDERLANVEVVENVEPVLIPEQTEAEKRFGAPLTPIWSATWTPEEEPVVPVKTKRTRRKKKVEE